MDLNHRPPGPEPVDKSHKSLSWRHLLVFGVLSDGQVGTSYRRVLATTLGNCFENGTVERNTLKCIHRIVEVPLRRCHKVPAEPVTLAFDAEHGVVNRNPIFYAFVICSDLLYRNCFLLKRKRMVPG